MLCGLGEMSALLLASRANGERRMVFGEARREADFLDSSGYVFQLNDLSICLGLMKPSRIREVLLFVQMTRNSDVACTMKLKQQSADFRCF